MTKDRFESKYDGVFIEDKINNKTYCCDAQNDWLDICDLLNKFSEENEQLKQSNKKAIELIYDGIVEMYDSKRDYAEKLLNKAIELIK